MNQLGDDVVVRSVEGLLEGRQGGSGSCLNCEAPLAGPFCSRCGQKASGIDISLRELLHEALDSLFSFDSRVWRTLRLLALRPGFLTLEYWAGRRARYVAPLRLYLFVSFVAFLVIGLVSRPEVVTTGSISQDGGVVQISTDGGSGEIDWEEDFADAPAPLRWFLFEIVRPAVENPERMQEIFLQRLPWAIFLMVPFFAALLRLLFRAQERFFVAHLVFSLHLHSLVFLFGTLGDLGDWLFGGQLFSSLGALVVPVVLLVSIRRVYANGWVRTLLKSAALLAVHVLALAVVMVGTVALSALAL